MNYIIGRYYRTTELNTNNYIFKIVKIENEHVWVEYENGQQDWFPTNFMIRLLRSGGNQLMSKLEIALWRLQNNE